MLKDFYLTILAFNFEFHYNNNTTKKISHIRVFLIIDYHQQLHAKY